MVTDVDGVRHPFEIRSMLVGTGHAMYAREVRHRDARGGYRFEILGDLEADAQDLFKLLRELGYGEGVDIIEGTKRWYG